MAEQVQEAPPQGMAASTTREVVKGIWMISGWTPTQLIMVMFATTFGVGIAGVGWKTFTDEQSALRHEMQQTEREASWTRFTEGELEKGRQATAREQDKNRKEREDDRKEREVINGTLRKVEVALENLTRAVKAKGGNIME